MALNVPNVGGAWELGLNNRLSYANDSGPSLWPPDQSIPALPLGCLKQVS